jgi:hypothetical protein
MVKDNALVGTIVIYRQEVRRQPRSSFLGSARR